MNQPYPSSKPFGRALRLLPPIVGASLLLLFALVTLRHAVHPGFADPILPPTGFPKLSLSLKTVTPTLAGTGGATLAYAVEIHNTGAYTATSVSFSDTIPAGTTYVAGSAVASNGGAPVYSGGTLRWQGDVGFDAVTTIDFEVVVDQAYSGTVRNTAVISQAQIAEPVLVSAETVVTDEPLFAIGKMAQPAKPGAGKSLTYILVVTNMGQPAVAVPLTVTDQVPRHTTFRAVGRDGTPGPGNKSVTWHRDVTLDPGQTSVFTFSVDVSQVASGTVILNDEYSVDSPDTALTAGEPYSVTIVDPIFTLFKHVAPDPPGSNREMTYTLSLFNEGSQATGLVVTDRVPAGVTYVRGGTPADGVVTWERPALGSGDTAEFTYTVMISDVANFYVVNDHYGVCSGEGVCAPGIPITSFVRPATFDVSISLDPLAKAPGGGGKDITPTILLKNEGPGTALGARALIRFYRISVQESDLLVEPDVGAITSVGDCGDKCVEYFWDGDIGYGEAITITTIEGQSTSGGEEGTIYSATVIITDTLANSAAKPLTATEEGHITHFSNLLPTKRAPEVIGRGQLMTYTINVWNSGLSTETPPYPVLVDTAPPSTTVISVNDGVTTVVSGTTMVSWTLPSMGPGDRLQRSYVVQVDADLVSGTEIINSDYYAIWKSPQVGAYISNTGKPVTTTVVEAGLIDSYKQVTPTLATPGPDNTFTYTLHVVNSGPVALDDVTLYDYLPWQNSTYQRDAEASAGSVISDIVSVRWTGSVGAFSEETITLTVKADPGFEGALTNTAVIDQPDLLRPVTVTAVAYVTDDPVLRITKSATPDPARAGENLRYTVRVANLGQQATGLLITDTLPAGTSYVPGSATAGGALAQGTVQWSTPVLRAGEIRTYGFDVTVGNVREVVNAFYGVSSQEGVAARGVPLVTPVGGTPPTVYLPLITR